MKQTCAILIFGLLGMATLLAGLPAPDPGGELLVFVQRDIRPSADRLNFNDGFRHFLAGLPPDTPVKIFLTISQQNSKVAEGPAGQVEWPADVEFALASSATTPYKNLLEFLEAGQVHDQTVIFVSSGASQDMYQLLDEGGFLPAESTFAPSTYAPMPRIIDYCKKNNVRLVGLFNPVFPASRLDGVTLSAFRYVVEDSGGKAYYDFTSYTGVFGSILRTGSWKR